MFDVWSKNIFNYNFGEKKFEDEDQKKISGFLKLKDWFFYNENNKFLK